MISSHFVTFVLFQHILTSVEVVHSCSVKKIQWCYGKNILEINNSS